MDSTRKRSSRSSRSQTPRKARRFVPALLLFATLGGGALYWHMNREPADISRINESLDLFSSLPANAWTRISAGNDGGWSRQGHAGMAYDSNRGSLLIFGSDSHGEDWDNTIHEFMPALREWRTLGRSAGADTYAVNEDGQAVAGTQSPQPWAMHTYDGVEYDPKLDALIVASTIDHTPVKLAGIGPQRTWIYERPKDQWRVLDPKGNQVPGLFSPALAYDELRDTFVLCKHGVWELGPTRSGWHRVSPCQHCDLHQTLVYDSRRGQLVLFGAYEASPEIWAYRPGQLPETGGEWTRLGSKACPPMTTTPVAYDRRADRFILVEKPPGASSEQEYRTYAYDAEAGACAEIAASAPATGHMNFMMVWHRDLEVSLLVTGDATSDVEVWAFRSGGG